MTDPSGLVIPAETSDRFRSLLEWQTWVRAHRHVFNNDCAEQLLHSIREHGIVDPLTQAACPPDDIIIAHDNYRETIKCGPLISRHRAILLEMQRIARRGLQHLVTRRCRIYAPEGLTDFALYMRGKFPKFIGSEYGQTDEEKDALFPIPSEDLHALSFPAGAFDLVLSNDVFEHLHDLDLALTEIARVLNDSGVLIATFPFLFQREQGIVKARRVGDRVEHLTEPEYHGNPLRPEHGSLVFEIPGWDVVSRARNAGFADAYFAFSGSARHGIMGKGINGVFVFVAAKQLISDLC